MTAHAEVPRYPLLEEMLALRGIRPQATNATLASSFEVSARTSSGSCCRCQNQVPTSSEVGTSPRDLSDTRCRAAAKRAGPEAVVLADTRR